MGNISETFVYLSIFACGQGLGNNINKYILLISHLNEFHIFVFLLDTIHSKVK